MNPQEVQLSPSNATPATHKTMSDIYRSKEEASTVITAKGSPTDDLLQQSSRSEEDTSSYSMN